MKESEIQKKILDSIKLRGGYAIKVITGNRKGIPDILACYRGVFIGVEVKGPTGKASALQIANLAEITKSGGKAILAKSVKEVMKVLQDIDDEKVSAKLYSNLI